MENIFENCDYLKFIWLEQTAARIIFFLIQISLLMESVLIYIEPESLLFHFIFLYHLQLRYHTPFVANKLSTT